MLDDRHEPHRWQKRARLGTAGRALLVGAPILFGSAVAHARPEYVDRLPASNIGCLTCHTARTGGEGCSAPDFCLQSFGRAFRDSGRTWSAALADLDADGDGCSNGAELGDPDGDGTVSHADFCARSPGSSVSNCSRTDAECCPEVSRSRETCECNEASPGAPICDPGTFLTNDEHTSPIYLVDATWEPFDTSLATSTAPTASCIRGLQDIWFRYVPECTGDVRIDFERPVAAVAYQSYGLGPEIACEPETSGFVIPNPGGPIAIRVSGGRGAIAATCLPDPGIEGESCHRPYFSYDVRLLGAYPPHAETQCPTDPSGDYWTFVQASCTGTATIALQATPGERADDPFYCHTLRGVTMGVYSHANCPERGEPLACASQQLSACDGRLDVSLPVRQGDLLTVKLGQFLGEREFVGRLAVSCTPGEPQCSDFCDPAADCDRDDVGVEGLRCACPPGYEGDGYLPEYGGSGCQLAANQCANLDYDCEYGVCTPDAFDPAAPPSCECLDGYFAGDLGCIRANECSSGGYANTGEGVIACRLNEAPNNACIEHDDGYSCACRPGFSPDPSSSSLRCIVQCGDGARGLGEACDDGNRVAGDGCSSACEIEWNHACAAPWSPTGPSQCRNTCGDGFIDANEDPSCDTNPTEPVQCRLVDTDPGPGTLLGLGLVAFVVTRRRRRW